MPQTLWTALHFPALPLEVFTRGQTAGALVVASGGQRPHVVAMSAVAAAGGVCEGMALAAAQALLPSLIVRNRELAAESAVLARLAAWSLQFTPTVSLAPPAMLLLEIGGCGRLFGGLEPLLSRLAQGVAALGFTAVIATAPTPRGAELLARSGRGGKFAPMSRLQAALGEVPTALLALTPAARDALADAGIDTFGACLDLPRDGLARRFGQALLDDLDRALGRLPEARAVFEPPEHYRGRLEFAVPVAEAEALVFAARRLLAEACGWLAGRGLGVLRWRLQAGHRKAPATLWQFKLSAPTHDVDVLTRIAQERLVRTELADGAEWLALESVETAVYQARNESLFGDAAALPEAAAALVDRLRARLGDAAVQTLAVAADHRPERASRPGAPLVAPPLPEAPRPLWLLPAPEAMRASGWEVLDGPERVESGWWDGDDARRDYYVIRLPRGETLWVYRDLRGDRWYCQGVFA